MSEGDPGVAGDAPAAYTCTPGIFCCSRWLTASRWAWFTPEIPSGTGSRCIPADAWVAVAAPDATSRCLIAAGRATIEAGFAAAAPGRVSIWYMSAAGVTPAMGDGPRDSEYATAPIRRPSAAYTGEPDMPAQMPPARLIAGESVSTMIRSRPGAMPSVTTPRTVAVNGSAVFPFPTVSPLAGMPATRSVTGNAAGHGSAGSAFAVDGDSQAAASATLSKAAEAVLGIRPANGCLVVMTPPCDVPRHTS